MEDHHHLQILEIPLPLKHHPQSIKQNLNVDQRWESRETLPEDQLDFCPWAAVKTPSLVFGGGGGAYHRQSAVLLMFGDVW